MNDKNIGYIILEESPKPEQFESPRIITDCGDRYEDDFVIEAVLQEANQPNRNKRIYEKSAIQSGIDHPMFQEKLARKNLFGEVNHPLSDDIKRQQHVPIDLASHVVEKVWWEGDILKGIVSACVWNEKGRAFAGAGRHGCDLAFSMRGLGGVVRKEASGLTRIKTPLIIIAYDYVTYPSHDKAYKTRIIKESTDIIKPEENLILESGLLVPCDYMEGLRNYIMDESKQIKDAIDQFELDPKTASLTENKNDLCIKLKSEDGSMVLFAEDAINKELNEFMKKFR